MRKSYVPIGGTALAPLFGGRNATNETTTTTFVASLNA
jgi:hypothetical protein